jgi:hypothetical protein
MNLRSNNSLASYKTKEINVGKHGIGSLIDAKALYEIYPNLIDSERLKIVANQLGRRKNFFIGEGADIMEVFKKRMVNDTTTKDFIEFEIELPEQEFFLEVIKVHVDDVVEEVGINRSEWEMTVDSGNLSRKNIYALRDYPEIIIMPTSEAMPDGVDGYKYSWKLFNGTVDDFIPVSYLDAAELIPNGAPLEEAAYSRGTIEMSAGKAFAVYKFDMTRMGWEMNVSDKAWQAGNYFVSSAEGACPPGMPNQIAWSDIEMNFNFEADRQMDNYIVAGSAPARGHNSHMSQMTHNPYQMGPTLMDFFRGSGGEHYSVNDFNLEWILDMITRKLDVSGFEANKNTTIDVITGTPGFRHLIAPELRRLDQSGVVEAHYEYSDEDGFDSRRKGVAINKKQYRSIYLDPVGKVKFHISSMLNSGILSGNKQLRGFPTSAWWIMVMYGNINNMDGTERNSSVYFYTNQMMEQRTYLVGSWTPNGPIGKVGAGRYNSGGDIGNTYKVINEQMKGIFIPNFDNIGIFYPDQY